MSMLQQVVLAQRGRQPRPVITAPTLTLDPAFISAYTTLSGGNLTATGSTVNTARATAAFSSGVYWVECEVLAENPSYPGHVMFGLCNGSAPAYYYPGQTTDSISYYGYSAGGILRDANIVASATPFAAGDVLNALVDADDKVVRFYRNGVAATALYSYGFSSAFVAVGGVFSGVSCRLNFGATSFIYGPPATI